MWAPNNCRMASHLTHLRRSCRANAVPGWKRRPSLLWARGVSMPRQLQPIERYGDRQRSRDEVDAYWVGVATSNPNENAFPGGEPNRGPAKPRTWEIRAYPADWRCFWVYYISAKRKISPAQRLRVRISTRAGLGGALFPPFR